MFRRFIFGLTLLGFVATPAWAQKQLVDRIVAVVNDEAITQSELDLYLRPLYDEFRQQYDGPELVRQLSDARLKLLKQMIEDRLVFQEAKAQNLTADEAEIDAMVAEFKSQFASEDEFDRAMTGEGFSLTKLRERYRRQVLVKKLHDLEIRSKIVVSPREIEEYYNAHPSEFAEQEEIRIFSITLRKSPEAERKGLQDEAAKSGIEAIQNRILAGESFETLAAELSEDEHAKEGGSVGWVGRGQMRPEIEKVLFDAKPGQISPVLETPQGYHLFKVAEKKAGRLLPLEAVRDQIRNVLFQRKGHERFEEWMEELKRRAYISVR